MNCYGCVRDFAGDALHRATLLLKAIRPFHFNYGAFGANSFRVNAKLYVGDQSLAEQGIEAKEELAAHGLKLFLPRRISDRYDESLPVETKRHGLSAQSFASDATPRDERGGFQDLFRLTSGAQELRQCSDQIVHEKF